jgi:hypothetical protein
MSYGAAVHVKQQYITFVYSLLDQNVCLFFAGPTRSVLVLSAIPFLYLAIADETGGLHIMKPLP